MTAAWDFVVRKDDLRQTAVLDAPGPTEVTLQPGQLLVRVDHFSLTANNVTYGALGDQLGYWRFYPAPEPWGRIPVWGYARVLASADSDLALGDRIYGYLPMSTHTVLQSGGVRDGGFTEVGEHRRALPAVYNRYRIVRPDGDPERERRVALFAPLYGTSWLLADWLVAEGLAGAGRVVASAASSKTALGLAHALQRDFGAPVTTVGLTSGRHQAFTSGTGHWSTVLTYDTIESIDTDSPTVCVDFGGNADLRLRVHEHLGDALVASVAVGIADWESTAPRPEGRLPGPRPHFFFAPTRVEQRTADWGAADLARRLSRSQDHFIERSHEWLTIRRGTGAQAIRDALLGLVDGEVPPEIGLDIEP